MTFGDISFLVGILFYFAAFGCALAQGLTTPVHVPNFVIAQSLLSTLGALETGMAFGWLAHERLKEKPCSE